MIKSLRDKLVSRVMKAVVDKTGLSRYGEMNSFSWSSKTSELNCELLLQGEVSAVHLCLKLERNAANQLVIFGASASREWLNLLLADLLIKPLEIDLPAKVSKHLRFIGL